MKKEFITDSYEQTIELGEELGSSLNGDELVLLTGDLGCGKTMITKGIARALGIQKNIASPTFNIVKEYTGKYKLYHFDLYRLNDIDELYEIGFTEYMNQSAVKVVEWADMFPEAFNGYRKISVHLEYLENGQRKITVEEE